MRLRRAMIVLAAAVLGLAGCGGAARPRATTRVADRDYGTLAGTADPAPTATSAATTARHRASSSRPSSSIRDGSRSGARAKPARAARLADLRHHATGGPAAIALATARLVAAAKHQPKPVLIPPPASPLPVSRAGPAAVRCMRAGGLYNVARGKSGAWVGTDPSNAQLLYVAGPYPTAAGAALLAKSLARREYARGGGQYIGFATFRSALSGELRIVTACLARGGPRRTMVF